MNTHNTIQAHKMTGSVNPMLFTAKANNQFAQFMARKSQISYDAMVSFLKQHDLG